MKKEINIKFSLLSFIIVSAIFITYIVKKSPKLLNLLTGGR